MIEITNYLVHLKFAILKVVIPYLENFYGFNFPSVSHVGASTQVNQRTAPTTDSEDMPIRSYGFSDYAL